MIAPGILCPKCKGPMLDERLNKRTDKSPDYTCANMLCMDKSGKYRTAIWAQPAMLQNAEVEDDAELAGKIGPASEKPTMRAAYKSLTEWVIKEIAPLYGNAEFGFPPEVIASCTATLFIQACKSGKVE
jgi:hypothetical protein